MFLTPDEVEAITGYQLHAYQRRWLTENGWIFEVARTGRPIVGRAYAESRFGAGVSIPQEKPWTPNLAALK